MRTAAILAAMCTMACGPSYSTGLGVDVYVTGETPLSQEQTNEAEQWTADLFTSMGYPRTDVEACIGQAALLVEPLDCDDCAGFQIAGEPVLYVDSRQACGWDVAAGFAHELAHWLQDCLHDPYAPDADHMEDAVWWHGFSTFLYTCEVQP